MAVVLVLRPHGPARPPRPIRRAAAAPRRGAADRRRAAGAAPGRRGGAAGGGAAPPFLGDYALSVLTDMAVMVLFAASLHFIMGPGGMASFGHAAYFGAGAYGAALAAKWLAAPMLAGLALAPLAAGLAGLAVRLLLRAAVRRLRRHADPGLRADRLVRRLPVGGGDGRRQRHPRRLARRLGRRRSSLLLPGARALRSAATLLLRRVIHAPFGYALRAQRDSPLRAEALGHRRRSRVRWLAFALAAAAAGVAGGLFAYAKGSVFPTFIGIPRSVDALLMVLLGGVQHAERARSSGRWPMPGLQEQLAAADRPLAAVPGPGDHRRWCCSSRRAWPARRGPGGRRGACAGA